MPPRSPGRTCEYNSSYVWRVSAVAAMGGFLFGYDWVVIGGAKPFYEEFFSLSTPFQIGWAMSSALLGCLFGALACGLLSERFGRKRLLILTGLLFTVSALGTAWSGSFSTFVWFRVLGGLGIGLASVLSPLYIAELVPAAVRGKFVSVNQLTIVIGLLAAQFINWWIAQPVSPDATPTEILDSWNGQTGWRWMFAAEALPASLFFGLMWLVPESPRWLVMKRRDEAARHVLEKVTDAVRAETAVQEIRTTLAGETRRSGFGELRKPGMLRILSLGVFLAVFQQWCGINTIFYYAEEIFTSAGYGISDVLLNIVITGSVMLVFTFVAIRKVDQWGRRLLMLIGAAGLAAVYLMLGLTYRLSFQGLPVLLLVVAAIAFYSCTLAPVTWVLISEIFPNRIRGAAMSMAVFGLWTGCLTLTYTFPFLNESLGTARTFWLYAAICAIGWAVLHGKLVETRGKSLEQIERDLIG